MYSCPCVSVAYLSIINRWPTDTYLVFVVVVCGCDWQTRVGVDPVINQIRIWVPYGFLPWNAPHHSIDSAITKPWYKVSVWLASFLSSVYYASCYIHIPVICTLYMYLGPHLLFSFVLHCSFLCRLVSVVINVLTSSVSLLAMWETRRDVLYGKYVNAS